MERTRVEKRAPHRGMFIMEGECTRLILAYLVDMVVVYLYQSKLIGEIVIVL